MSAQSKSHPGWFAAKLLVMMAALWTFATVAAAQDPPGPKVELFGGYTFFYPGADVTGQLPLALFPISSHLESNPRGAGASITYDFNRWFGLTLDASTDWGSGEVTVADRIDDAAFANLSLGPKFTFRSHRFSPFVEALLGDHRLTPDAFHDVDKLGFMLGGGLDINLSRHIALRLLRADFIYSNYSFGHSVRGAYGYSRAKGADGAQFHVWRRGARIAGQRGLLCAAWRSFCRRAGDRDGEWI